MKKKMQRFWGLMLSFVLVLSLMPGMSLTAYADGTTYNPASTYTGFGDLNTNNTEVTIGSVPGITWYVIANDSSTVTLLSKQSFGRQQFNSDTAKGNAYETSEIKTYVEGLTGEGQPLAGISSVISDLTLIDTATAQGLSETKRKGAGTNWWLCSPGDRGDSDAAFVNGDYGSVSAGGENVGEMFGVRPALKLDLSKVTFDSVSKTFSQNSASNTTEHTTLQVGDVLRVGDTINSTTVYDIGGFSLVPDSGPWTMVRADFSVSDSELNVTESATGAYYLFKGQEDLYTVGYDAQGIFGTYFTATETSDGIYVTSISGPAVSQMVSFVVHEPVTGVTLTPNTAQTIDIDGTVAFTASITPDNATDKTVKWSVGGTNADAVTIYSDEACETPVTLDTATETLTVYAKGISAGSATVTCTSNADSTKSASCEVTVNAGNTTFNPASTYTGFGGLNTNNTELTISEVPEKTWYVIANDSTTVTLLAKNSFASIAFNSSGTGNDYANSEIKTYVEGLTGEGQPLAGISSVISDLTLIDTATAQGLSETKRKGAGTEWWLCSPGYIGGGTRGAVCVWGDSAILGDGYVDVDGRLVDETHGVRPALKLNLSSVIFESETNTFSLKPVVTEYPLWVGGTQVTSENASNIDGYNKASYDDSTHTLTLNGYNLTVSNGDSEIDYGIKYTGSEPLTINLEGKNAIEGYLNDYNNKYRGINNGIYITRDTDDIAADVTFTGEGSLSVKATHGIVSYTESNSANPVGNITFSGTGEIDVASSAGAEGAICTNYGTVNISGGTLTAAGYTGIEAQKGINISGGTVSVTGTSDSGMSSHNPVSITGGTVTAIGETKGISAGWYGDGDTVTIGANVKTVVISGEEKAVDGKVMNAIAGSAWVNKDGTGNKSEIEASDVPRELSEYKKMVFSSYIPLDTTETNLTPINISIPNSHTVPAVGDVLEASCVATDIVYQWYRGTTLLIGETNSSYTATISDIGKTLKVVVKQTKQANGTEYSSGSEPTLASEETGAVVKKTPATLSVDDAKTNAGISYLTETVTPDTGYEVSSSGTANIAITSLTDILNSEGVPVIYVRIAETSDTAAGDWVAVILTARPIAPTGLTTEKATNGSTANGKISGVDTTMEYSADGTSWTDVTGGTTIEELTPGTYQVRVKATANVPHGRATEVTVGSKQIILTDSQKPTAKTGLTYTGSEQALIDAPTVALPEGATEMRYAIGTDATTAPNDGWNASIPTGTEVKTYYVWYKAVGDEDHSDSKPACITVTISKPAEAPAPADEEKGEADFKPNAAAPDVKGVEQEAIKSQMEDLAKADDTKLKAGQVKDVTVSMETKAVAEKNVPKKEASAIKETAEGMIPAKDRESTKCDFLDIAVSKIVIVYDVKYGQKVKNKSDSTKLTNLAQVIDIPVKYDLTGKFNPLIVRYHNGKAEAFRRLYAAPAKDALKDGTYYVEGTGKNAIVHIYTNRFSTYALLTSGTEEYPKLGDSVTVYRLYYGPTMEHFYTTSAYERKVLIDKYGWVDEGIAWKSPKAPTTDEEKKTIKPVYRLFNPFTTDHHYTKDANERKTLIDKYGWKDEGVAFYSNDKGDATVYRLWHPGLITGAHHFTTSKYEYDVLVSRGWVGESAAFKVNAEG